MCLYLLQLSRCAWSHSVCSCVNRLWKVKTAENDWVQLVISASHYKMIIKGVNLQIFSASGQLYCASAYFSIWWLFLRSAHSKHYVPCGTNPCSSSASLQFYSFPEGASVVWNNYCINDLHSSIVPWFECNNYTKDKLRIIQSPELFFYPCRVIDCVSGRAVTQLHCDHGGASIRARPGH